MKSKTPIKILVAKMVPDLHRLEPVNIGVIAINQRNAICRFKEKRSIPKPMKYSYDQWLDYWEILFSRDYVNDKNNEKIDIESDGYIKRLLECGKEQYYLVDQARYTYDPKLELIEIVEIMYEALVVSKGTDKEPTKKMRLQSKANELFESIDLEKQKNRPVDCHINGIIHPFKINYVIGNGTPDYLMQRVVLDDFDSVSKTGWIYEWINKDNTNKISKNHCIVLSNLSENEKTDETEAAKGTLTPYSQIIDLSNMRSAKTQINELLNI